MEKAKQLKTAKGETLLPEAILQHIQSFLTGKEAARTTLISNSWYNAWLTRPTLDFDQQHFTNGDPNSSKTRFAEFATKSMARYQDLNLKIDSLRLRCTRGNETLANKLIMKAMKMGATDLDLEMRSLPREVLESETLVRLSVSGRIVEGNVRCWRLKSLNLNRVHMKSDDVLRDIISCCVLIEELSLCHCRSSSKMFTLSAMNLSELHKLRILFLETVSVDSSFFSGFECRFPCLKDLSVVRCYGFKTMQIVSTSLQRISFVEATKALRGEFDVPNLVSFSYSGMAIPSLSIQSSREWESHVRLTRRCRLVVGRSWLLKLKRSLRKLSPSKISLYINLLNSSHLRRVGEEEGDIHQGVPESLVLENLTIEPSICSYNASVTGRLLRMCRPKFITLHWDVPESSEDWWPDSKSVDSIGKEVKKQVKVMAENLLDLKEVNVEVYEESVAEWRMAPLDASATPENKGKIRFQFRFEVTIPPDLLF
ncbi:hypothetical protein C2S51_021372 [Perilla frutescens var. frutescens]|nr:hypothetical protein C2S51_021372 [Perilla frutescens var. frutescens]